MPVYTVFDCDGVSVEVSDSALERAAAGSGPLATELVNAAALARRPSLVPQIQAGLTGPDRAPKLAAAKALLSLGARATIQLLDRLAATESDAVVANVYTAVATRLRGPEAATAQFLSPKTDPQVARFLISNYNSYLQLESGDLAQLRQERAFSYRELARLSQTSHKFIQMTETGATVPSIANCRSWPACGPCGSAFWLITMAPSSAIDPLSVTENVRSCRSTRQYSAFSI
jgi:hypothetical protein